MSGGKTHSSWLKTHPSLYKYIIRQVKRPAIRHAINPLYPFHKATLE